MSFSREEWRKSLSQKELEEAILHLSESEDALEIFFDDNDLNFDKNVLITYVTGDSGENIDFELPNIENMNADIKKYIGVRIMMSVVHVPSIRSYWSKFIGMDSLKPTMPQKHFEKIRRYINFNDNSEMLPREDSNHDRLYKLRPVINHLLEKYQSIPYEKDLSVDEQICYTKVRSYLKQKGIAQTFTGTSYEFLTTVDTIDTTTVAWKDNKVTYVKFLWNFTNTSSSKIRQIQVRKDYHRFPLFGESI
ncbi:hypothetical protein ILUMI_22901 [Ignelater luminosus]|uniref:PiggyBac transposable element-derived protein domain-containing protein n=1 Tax=Ignelater luminosus TaxID=2038154 RepID=A0A8K0G2F6_IGNLU|nr:hypothetical protein ILUMI_22901 [Ignelater luminosus]